MARGRNSGTEANEEDKKKLNRDSLKKAISIFRFVKPYRIKYMIGFAFLILSTGTTMSFGLLIGQITSVIQGKSAFSLNQVTLFFVGVLIAQAIFSFFRIYFFSQVSERAMADVRRATYSKIITLPIPFFEQRRVGELTSRISADVSQLQDVLTLTLAELFRQVATLTIGTAIIFYVSWKLTLFMLATFPVIIIAAIVFGKFIRKLSKLAQDQLATANVIVEETLQSVNIVKAFTNEKLEINRYGTALQQVVNTALRAAKFRGVFVSFVIFALFGGIIGVVWYGGSLVLSNEMPFADLLTFIVYTTFIGGSVAGMGDLYAQLQKTVGASERILEILGETSEVNATEEVPLFVPVQGHVRFEDVRFSYPSRPDIAVLKGISLNVAAGRKIALVGQSGAGKSTIVQLLMRYYQLGGGKITVDDRDLATFNVTELRKNIAVVPQEVMLFGGTIQENIQYGKAGATEAEVREAARKANALQFIDSFPEGLQTIVGERGVKLSGGQRQRIAIARAILKDPAILVLDEATSSLDAESERLVQEALDELMQNRTTIIIAHRLATIRKVDMIYVMREGQIAETGTHDQLAMQEDGIYANLVRLQFETIE
ncbi:ABC transporter ATP-binding protein [Spirosoma utsteinense]|uniref:ABC-type multidrug transport system fused ATPase/permease subunit n=1 Tax=Spirosoma utsteinense TaxID=2585773 RepID=A0ABR6W3X3_9BACT|nr:ABC transporter transmembrane domain-containing protein [Spirosoma utsteinense]MBC3788024.1 ABC-type multidrug transport system fused ATPase/permease subunit [Spirosoma utsteinense]MBC3791274.1 ABC-type multidrug transport system fused ATPase/permease subunit [Spirosoma utsteinense]